MFDLLCLIGEHRFEELDGLWVTEFVGFARFLDEFILLFDDETVVEVHVVYGALADLILDKARVLGPFFLRKMWQEAIDDEVFEGLVGFLTSCGITPGGSSEEDLEKLEALERQLMKVLPLFFGKQLPIFRFFMSLEDIDHYGLQLFWGQKVDVVLILLLLIHLLDNFTSSEQVENFLISDSWVLLRAAEKTPMQSEKVSSTLGNTGPELFNFVGFVCARQVV